MSRSGYTDDMDDQWAFIRWRGAVSSALRGKRGQAFLRELIRALDALPKPELIANELEEKGAVCAIGAVGKARGIDMSVLDPDDREGVAYAFDIPHTLACEIFYENDECGRPSRYARFERMRKWAIANLNGDL